MKIYNEKLELANLRIALQAVSGRLGKQILVNSKAYGPHFRKVPVPGSRKDEVALKRQYSRTKLLNVLAGELNSIIRSYCGNFKDSDFYQKLLSRLRKEPLDNRFLLLRQLRGAEVNTEYPLNKLGSSTGTVQVLKNKITVSLKVLSHPPKGKHKANCYFYEVILLLWNKNNKTAIHSSQLCEWIFMKNGLPEFEFSFPKTTDMQHWLLCNRQRLGIDEREIEAFAAEGMQITDAGTFNKKDLALLEKRKTAAKAKRVTKAGQKAGKVRVKAKRIESKPNH